MIHITGYKVQVCCIINAYLHYLYSPTPNYQALCEVKGPRLTKCFFVKNSLTRALQNLSWTDSGFLFLDCTIQ